MIVDDYLWMVGNRYRLLKMVGEWSKVSSIPRSGSIAWVHVQVANGWSMANGLGSYMVTGYTRWQLSVGEIS